MSNPFNIANCLRDLPVNNIVKGIVEHSFIPFSVSLVTSRTGSGKTMIVPAALAQAHGHCIYVIEPRRILAIDAARNLSRIYGVPVGSLFGYGVGSRGGEESKFDAGTQVVFVTTGYAIASGIVNTGTSFVIDEYHETTLDLSIAKAILEGRRREGQDVRLVMMSATGDETVESAYWSPTCGDFPVKTFHTDGVSYPCEFLHRPAHSIRDSVIELLSTGSTGILGFLPGQEEINDALRSLADADLFRYLPESAPATACVSISSVHGQMDADQRDEALRGPSAPGEIRILLGTNVIESGINLDWVDSGVTSGQGRSVESQPNGSTVMTTVDLCRARIDQQKGRVNRFRPGRFILAASLEYAKRHLNEKPEILKTSLERVVISCAKMGVDPRTLRFDYRPDHDRITLAEDRLIEMGILTESGKLSGLGTRIADLPFSLEAGVMLEYAKSRGRGYLGLAVPLIAAYEAGGLAFNRKQHMYKHSNYIVDGAHALITIDRDLRQSPGAQRTVKERAKARNVNLRRFDEALQIVRTIIRHYDVGPGHHPEIICNADYESNPDYTEIIDVGLRECIGRRDDLDLLRTNDALRHISAELVLVGCSSQAMLNLGYIRSGLRMDHCVRQLPASRHSAVPASSTYMREDDTVEYPLVTGSVRTLPGKYGQDFTFASDLVFISGDDITRTSRYWNLPKTILSFAAEDTPKQVQFPTRQDAGMTLGDMLRAAMAATERQAFEIPPGTPRTAEIVDYPPGLPTRASTAAPWADKRIPDLTALAGKFNTSKRR